MESKNDDFDYMCTFNGSSISKNNAEQSNIHTYTHNTFIFPPLIDQHNSIQFIYPRSKSANGPLRVSHDSVKIVDFGVAHLSYFEIFREVSMYLYTYMHGKTHARA